MKKQFLLYVFIFSAFYSKAQTQYKSFHFTTDDGLPSNIIYGITQDNKGNIVLGTDNGLSIFNGNDFNNYNVKDGLLNPYIVSICKDNDAVWMINYNGKLQKFQNNKITTTSVFTDYFNYIDVFQNKLFLYNMQNRFLNKTYSFATINKENFELKRNPQTEIFNRIAAPILHQNNDEIKIENDFLSFKNYKIKLPKEIKFIHKVVFRQKDVCILEDYFLFVLNFNGNLVSKIKLPSNLSKNQVYKFDFVVDKLQNCWLSIQNQGLFILKNNNWIALSESIGLNNEDNINFLFSDNSGKLWIATNEKGLFCIPTTQIETIFLKNAENYFNGFATSLDENALFFSSKFHLYSYQKNTKIQLLETSKVEIILSNFEKTPVYNTVNSNPYFWNKNQDLLYIKGKQIIEKMNNFGYVSLVGNNAICFSELKNNKIIESAVNNKIPVKEKIKSIIKHKNEYYFNNGQAIDIRTFDRKFIYKKRDLKFKINGFIEDFAFINDTMWVAANNSIYKIVNEKIIDSITEINNVKLENVRKIKEIKTDIFLCAGNGLFKIGQKENKVFNKFNFLPTNDVYNVAGFDENLFVATNAGIAKIKDSITTKKSKVPNFEVFYKNQKKSKIELKTSLQFAEIQLKIQNFNAQQNQIIQYKVDETNWLQNKTKTINFQTIAYGNHIVLIRVKDVNSDWTTQKFEIYRAYPFYLKWWFFTLLAITGFLFYKYQIKKINIKKPKK